MTTGEFEIRGALKSYLSSGLASLTSEAILLDELPLMRGEVRADLVLLPDFHCFELKSDRDSLARLVGQGAVYSATFNKVSLVTAPRHLLNALEIIPDWWGVLVFEQGVIRVQRRAKVNASLKREALASMLSKSEALELLSSKGIAAPTRKPLYELHEMLSSVFTLKEIRRFAVRALEARATDTALALPA